MSHSVSLPVRSPGEGGSFPRKWESRECHPEIALGDRRISGCNMKTRSFTNVQDDMKKKTPDRLFCRGYLQAILPSDSSESLPRFPPQETSLQSTSRLPRDRSSNLARTWFLSLSPFLPTPPQEP